MLAGCWQERREVPKQEIEPQVIKVNQSQGKDIHFIDLLEDYRLINLELTEVSALINPEKALLVDDRFYLLDRRLRQVQVFDTKGRFVTNLVPAGAGPGECHSITALAYDKDHQQILAGCREKRKIFRFDHQLNFLGAITLSGGIDRIAYLGGSLLAISTGYYTETNSDLVIADDRGNVRASYFPFPAGARPMLFDFMGALVANRDGALYNTPTSSLLYQIDRQGNVYQKYQFDFGSRQFPQEKVNNIDFFLQQPLGTYSILLNKLQESDDYLVFSYLDGRKPRSAAYDKVNRKLYTYDNMQKDGLLKLMMRTAPIGTTQNGYFISAFTQNDIQWAFGGQLPDDQTPADLYSKLTNGRTDSEANPVIFLYKLKKPVVSNVSVD